MSLPATNIVEVQSGGSDTLNGGTFDPGNANMATDGAATSATGGSPVFTSASYNFVAGDVGHWVFIKSGTNWLPGWYKIASVASNAATLSAAIGSAVLWNSSVLSPTIVAGCASTASPTSATWTVDYSQVANVPFSLTGLTTAAANAIILTSSATKAMVGNGLVITGGTNFTTGYYSVSSVSAGVSLTVDRTCTSAAGVSGTAGLGGALATPNNAIATVAVTSNILYFLNATYSCGATNTAAGSTLTFAGYTSIRGDFVTKTIFQASTTGVTLLNLTASNNTLFNLELDGNSNGTTTAVAHGGGNFSLTMYFCRLRRCVNGVTGGGTILSAYWTEIDNHSGAGVSITGAFTHTLYFCNVHNNGAGGLAIVGSGASINAFNSLIVNNTGVGCDCRTMSFYNCTVAGNTSHGTNTIGRYNVLINNICYGNGGLGFSGAVQTAPLGLIQNNAVGGNTSGNYTSTTLYHPADVALTASPFTSSTDFSLNNTAGGGALCRGTARATPGLTTSNNLDIGAVQHADPAAGGMVTPVISYGIEGVQHG